jgi:anti-sigma regulatory factor (Ser/Thr protein kinase)
MPQNISEGKCYLELFQAVNDLEAVANAVIHGNRKDPQKRVYVTCRCSMDGEVLLTIRDEGPGLTVTQYRIRRRKTINY